MGSKIMSCAVVWFIIGFVSWWMLMFVPVIAVTLFPYTRWRK